MNPDQLAERLGNRLAAVGVPATAAVIGQCAAYLALLHRWNARLNLTGFDLSAPSDEAVDRLVVEPLAAATLVRSYDRTHCDIGTGGGSPAVPLKIACPWLSARWYEARAKKAAFLREVVRTLELGDVEVVASRFGEGCEQVASQPPVDVITLRGVRVDPGLIRAIHAVMHVDSRVVLFGRHEELPLPAGLVMSANQLWLGGPTVAVMARKRIAPS
ncbi:MAG: class I SAM-dependent methyltransferase [Acidobacteria bacterium]|nr:class I SAM-dependent methyltransferase [Acidobacteriota bacterium]